VAIGYGLLLFMIFKTGYLREDRTHEMRAIASLFLLVGTEVIAVASRAESWRSTRVFLASLCGVAALASVGSHALDRQEIRKKTRLALVRNWKNFRDFTSKDSN
jgi:hypothetical protein